jgi:hypothetical protein
MRLAFAGFTVAAALPIAAQQGKRAEPPITVGKNVQISSAFANRPHYELIAAADPAHPERMVSCAMVYYTDRTLTAQHCYSTFDGGLTWKPTMVLDSGTVAGDPTAAYGFGDTAYIVTLFTPLDIPRRYDYRTHVYRSLDGGHTWSKSSDYRFIDREYVVVDRTGGKYNGRVYINGQGSVRGMKDERPSGIYLWRSSDGGRTFEGPAVRFNAQGGGTAGAANLVVMSDGTVGMYFGQTIKGRSQDLTVNNSDRTANATIEFMASKDGGETFDPSVTVSDFYMDRPRSEGGNIGQIAVDPSNGPYKDRLYIVWPDARTGRLETLLSYSADKGKTWSKPIVVNDDRSFTDMDKKRDHILPAVTVNKNGVVAVTWYDRRESADNLGWKIRVAASFDGGETFTKSVVVSSDAQAYTSSTQWPVQGRGGIDSASSSLNMGLSLDLFFESGGHTTGFVADANGVFHPVWVDNRTGVSQMWTAPVTIAGSAIKNGAPELADLENVSKNVGIELTQTTFNRSNNTMKATLRIKNVSKDTLRAPLKLRVVNVTSGLGTPEIVSTDNGVAGVGAIIDISSLLQGGALLPGAVSASRELTFRLTDLQTIRSGRDYTSSLIQLNMRAFGRPK